MARACGCRARGLGIDSRQGQTKKTFADIGNLLTTAVFAGLSKHSGFIHLIHTIQSQEQHNVGTRSWSVPTRYRSLISY